MQLSPVWNTGGLPPCFRTPRKYPGKEKDLSPRSERFPATRLRLARRVFVSGGSADILSVDRKGDDHAGRTSD